MEKMYHIQSGYRYNNELGKLEWLQINEVEFTMNPDDDVIYKVTQGGVPNEFRTKEIFDLFATEEDFKKGRKMNPELIKATSFWHIGFTDVEDYAETWVVDNGVIKKLKSTECTFIAKPTHKMILKGYNENYENKEALLECNDLIIVEKDGTERVHTSTKSRVKLTDEQQKAIETIREAIYNAEKLGVHLLYDADMEEIKGLNILNVKDCKHSYGLPSENYVGVSKFAEKISDINILCTDDDVYVTFKN